MNLLASLTTFIEAHNQWALVMLFALLALQSLGLLLPGGAALIACAVLASKGALSIVAVIVVASLAAIIGDNVGYWTARKRGSKLLSKTRLTRRYASEYLPRGERFFARHGGKAVFFARFIAMLRATAGWTAGLARMGGWQFFAWDTTGAIVWATTVGLVAYYLGDAAADVIRRYGLLAAAGLIVFSALGYIIVRRVEKRAMKEAA